MTHQADAVYKEVEVIGQSAWVRLLAASTGHQPGRALPREKGAECI
jgi:hypothetical protein